MAGWWTWSTSFPVTVIDRHFDIRRRRPQVAVVTPSWAVQGRSPLATGRLAVGIEVDLEAVAVCQHPRDPFPQRIGVEFLHVPDATGDAHVMALGDQPVGGARHIEVLAIHGET